MFVIPNGVGKTRTVMVQSLEYRQLSNMNSQRAIFFFEYDIFSIKRKITHTSIKRELNLDAFDCFENYKKITILGGAGGSL